MSSSTDDDGLMEELARAMGQVEAVPDHRREAARAAFTWRTIDEELLALTHDSLELADAAVRGALDVRTLGFESDGLSLEVEVDGDRVVGQVLDADVDEVVVESVDDGSHTAPVDSSGIFSVVVPAGPVRFGVRVEGVLRRTPWIVLGARTSGRLRRASRLSDDDAGRLPSRLSGLDLARDAEDLVARRPRAPAAAGCRLIAAAIMPGDERRCERGPAPPREHVVEDPRRLPGPGAPGRRRCLREGVDQVATEREDVHRDAPVGEARHLPSRSRDPTPTAQSNEAGQNPRAGVVAGRGDQDQVRSGSLAYTSCPPVLEGPGRQAQRVGQPADRLIRSGSLVEGGVELRDQLRLEHAAARALAVDVEAEHLDGAAAGHRLDHARDERAVAGVLREVPGGSGMGVRLGLAGDVLQPARAARPGRGYHPVSMTTTLTPAPAAQRRSLTGGHGPPEAGLRRLGGRAAARPGPQMCTRWSGLAKPTPGRWSISSRVTRRSCRPGRGRACREPVAPDSPCASGSVARRRCRSKSSSPAPPTTVGEVRSQHVTASGVVGFWGRPGRVRGRR